jgi:hypothetical protein
LRAVGLVCQKENPGAQPQPQHTIARYEAQDEAKKVDLLGIEPRTFPMLVIESERLQMLRENYTTKPQALVVDLWN